MKRYRVARGVLACRRRCLGCGCTDVYGCDGGCAWASAERCTNCVGRRARLRYSQRGGVVAIAVA